MTVSNNLQSGLSAYREIAGAARAGRPGAAETAAAGGGAPFVTALRDAGQAAIEQLREGERQSMGALAGTADIRDVILAVNNAEVTLQTVVAVRDKVIQAYQEIVRMPI